MNAFLVLLAIPLARFLIFSGHWHFFRTVQCRHSEYLAGVANTSSEKQKEHSSRAASWIVSNMTEIKRRVAKIGVANPKRSFMEPKGYGFVAQETISILDNMLYLDEEILSSAVRTINIAKGHCANQAKLSLSPFYWLEVLFFLPRELVSASGIELTSKLADITVRVIQLAYWIACILVLMVPQVSSQFLG